MMKKKSNTPQSSSENPDTNKQNDDFFAEYLKGDSAVSELYKNIDSPEPPGQLNQRILAAARTAAKKSPVSNSRWLQAGSWAASAAIISLAGILAHNTWQTEQPTVEKTLPELLDTPPENTRPAYEQAKKTMRPDTDNDSRKLVYKAAPAPTMQPAAQHFKLEKSTPGPVESDSQNISTRKNKIPDLSTTDAKIINENLSEQLTWLNDITELIRQNKTEQARELLQQFQRKYPDYPIDPVILKQLPP